MDGVLGKSAVKRVVAAKEKFGIIGQIKVLTETAKSAAEAAAGLGIEVGQIASSIIFKLPDNSPLLVITSLQILLCYSCQMQVFNKVCHHWSDLDYSIIQSNIHC